jgi:hypothetical protein
MRKIVSLALLAAIARISIAAPSHQCQWQEQESYQSACVGSIDAEEGNRRLGGSGCGGGVAPGRSEAGNGGAGDTSPESGAEGAGGRHGG